MNVINVHGEKVKIKKSKD